MMRHVSRRYTRKLPKTKNKNKEMSEDEKPGWDVRGKLHDWWHVSCLPQSHVMLMIWTRKKQRCNIKTGSAWPYPLLWADPRTCIEVSLLITADCMEPTSDVVAHAGYTVGSVINEAVNK
jgi:hypothetical protein